MQCQRCFIYPIQCKSTMEGNSNGNNIDRVLFHASFPLCCCALFNKAPFRLMQCLKSEGKDFSPGVEESDKAKIWSCRKCLYDFPTRKALVQHRKTHKSDFQEPQTYSFDAQLEAFVCSNCSAEFPDEEEAKDHVRNHHIDTFTCAVCNEKFSKAYVFACHMQQHDAKKLYRCPLCSHQTLRRTSILTHINRIHYHKFYYYCKACGKGFNDTLRFKEHANEHLGLRPFVCIVCSKAFVYSQYLQLHQIRYHTVGIEGQLLKNQCALCLRVFSKDSTLENHMLSRHSRSGPREKRHLCDICGKGFATKDKLRIHYRVHTGVKPFTCQFCSKSFTKKEYLVMHERIHTGEKPYTCHYCGKSFNQGAPLRIHLRSHTGEKPYICQFCNNGFISKGSLQVHQKNCLGGIK